MANRIVIFASDPGRIQAILNVDLPYPRDPESPKFRHFLDKIYTLMTKAESKVESQPYTYRLPDVSVAELSGLLETMVGHETNDKINLSELAEDLHLDIDNVFPLTDALIILKFIKVEHSEFIFLAAGKQFAAAGILERKHLFARHLLKYVPLAHHIREVLDSEPHHRISENVLLEELQVSLNEEEAERLLKVIIDWGRYAEIFAYDYDSGILSLENPE